LLPQLGGLIDQAVREVDSPNIPPPSQWQTSNATISSVTDRRPSPPSDVVQPPDDSSIPKPPTDITDANSAPGQPADEDDYAAICKSESVKNGLKSLKQDFEEARKNEDGRYGLRFFREKLKLDWATLKKCIRDPMQKAVVEKLERDPIIFEAQ
jgi:hypothetical protein